MANIKNWLIHLLGGITKEEGDILYYHGFCKGSVEGYNTVERLIQKK